MAEYTIATQLDRCDAALKSFSRCMRERQWQKLPARVDLVSREMELLRARMIEIPDLDDELSAQVKYLEIRLRRTQRQLAVHMGAVGADIATLNSGMRQADAAKALLKNP
ncbi:hypothetical protein D8Y20_03515 [Mariprofundus sp. EBB-1]|uniref:hypothetical protein n=1 Tax=Mariprofundus sp. EBB-1 TaxID=2650971 RepID=UPI000EF1F665|nr:hypothetical protein [Mariprofundus sp. EBB-1]RLL54352.1 hypothetical protein D8Y20_03515 [Mariprofundus sp. EBB-1]